MPRCPSCFTPMRRLDEDTVKSSTCPNCFGRWLAAAALTRRMRLDLETNAGNADPLPDEAVSPLADLAEMASACNSTAVLRCPQCEKPMLKQKFHPLIPVLVDRCKPCACMWLDAGEFMLIRRLHRELMTSQDQEIIARRKKFSAASGSWDTQANQRSYTGIGPADTLASSDRDTFDFLAYLLGRK